MGIIEKQISRLSLREKILLGITLMSIVVFFFSAVYIPMSREVDDARRKLDLLSDEIGNVGLQIGMIKEELLDADSTEQEDLDGILEYVLDRGKLSNLLEELGRVSKESNVEFLAMVPKNAARKDGYIELIIQLNLNSSFKNLIRFMESLEKKRLPVNIIDINIGTGVSGHINSSLYGKTLIKESL